MLAQCFLSVKMSTCEPISFVFDVLSFESYLRIKFDLETKPSNLLLLLLLLIGYAKCRIPNATQYEIWCDTLIDGPLSISALQTTHLYYIKFYAACHINIRATFRLFVRSFSHQLKRVLCAN